MEGEIVGREEVMAPVEEGKVSGIAAVKKVAAPVDLGRLVAETRGGGGGGCEELWNS